MLLLLLLFLILYKLYEREFRPEPEITAEARSGASSNWGLSSNCTETYAKAVSHAV